MSACCPSGGLGPAPLNDRTPKGRIVTWSPIVITDDQNGDTNTLNNNDKTSKNQDTTKSSRPALSCYHVGPEQNPKRVVLVFTDVFGIDTGNHRAFCDVLQSRLGDDTAVYCPDLFRGRPLMHDYGRLLGWMNVLQVVWGVRTRCSAISIDADLREIVEPNVRATGCQMCGVVGFCFGGWVVARCLALNNGRSMFAAGVGIHPTFQLESLAAGGTTAMELGERTQNKPILFLPAKEDDGLKASSPVVQTMAKRRGVTAEHISVEFPTMPHGFVSRGRFMGPEYRIAQDRAIQLTVDFMEKHLKV